MKNLYHLAVWGNLLSAILVITMGGIVRVTGSGLGCPDWPLCHGSLIPPLDLGAWLEYTHRLLAAVTTIMTTFLVVTAIARYGYKSQAFRLILLAPILLILQAGLGALTVLQELSPNIALAHTAMGMIFVGTLSIIAVTTSQSSYLKQISSSALRATTFPMVICLLAIATFALILSGAYVTRTGASLACLGFPLCEVFGEESVATATAQLVHMVHRWMAGLVFILMLFALWVAWKVQHRPALLVTTMLAGVLTIQIVIGASNVLLLLPRWAQAIHLTLAAVFFVSVILVVATVWSSGPSNQKQRSPHPNRAFSYWRLTKPKITSLLLVTTIGGMLAATGGKVPWLTTLTLVLGGVLCAGGAAAMNSYLDREKDQVMERTRNRPLPTKALRPKQALIFSIAISLLSLPLFLSINILTASLATIAWLYYVFLYSIYLKGRTAQNIVIGGAAGAFPPLIGWVAVTGSFGWEAMFLFLIVFLWTPPHAWALTLIVKEDYARVQTPMLPVVKGDALTRQQILIYGVILVVASVIPALIGLFGTVYLVSTILLGVFFILLALKLYQSATLQWASRLYRYSTIYLALVFVALAFDRAISM